MSRRPEEGAPHGRARDILRRLFPEHALGRDVDEELHFHVEERVEERMRAGLTEEEARRDVLEAFGDLARIRAECREIGAQRLERTRKGELLMGLARDIRIAARRLRRSLGFTAVGVAILALGIGASVAMFSVLYEVMLRPLPYEEPDRLVRVWPGKIFNAAMVRWFDEEVPALERAAGLSGWSFTLVGEQSAELVVGAVVTPGYFEALGVRPMLGRTFLPEEAHPDRAGVVVLSHGFWRRLGADPGILGRDLRLETYRRPALHRVVGVMPAEFRPLGEDAEVWAPLQLAPGRTVATDSSWYVNDVVARLAPGATAEQASGQVRAAASRLRLEAPAAADEEEVRRAGVALLKDDLVGSVRPLLWALFAAVGLVLLIGCVNLSTLLLARAAGQRTESALRAALGAGRAQLLGERLVESGLLALAGGILGVLLAWAALASFSAGLGVSLPRGGEIALSLPALAFALGVSVASILLFGVLPALKAASGDPGAALRGAPRPGGGGGRHRLDRGLVAAEVALTVVLLAGAALALRSFAAVLSTDPGLRTEGVVAVSIQPPESRLTSGAARRAFYDELEGRLRALPGVQSVGSIHLLPLTRNNWSYPYLAEGHAPPENAPLPSANFRAVTPAYFTTMGIPLLRGRSFRREDGQGAEPVAIINRAMAALLWPAESALGKEIRIFGSMPVRVVGVVGDVRQHSLETAPLPEMYLPFHQYTLSSMTVLVHAPGGEEAVLRAAGDIVRQIDPGVAIRQAVPLEEVLAESLTRRRLFVSLLTGFGALALVLAGFGIYGVTAHLVSRRVPEFGLRLALGAAPPKLVGEALVWGLAPVLLGAAVGLLAALLSTRVLESLLYGVEPTDAASLGAAVGVLVLVALAALMVPARRAAGVDPATALRSD